MQISFDSCFSAASKRKPSKRTLCIKNQKYCIEDFCVDKKSDSWVENIAWLKHGKWHTFQI